MVASFDLYYLLVENVFGSLALTGLGLAALFAIMGVASKMSSTSIIMVVGTFIMVFAVGSVGAYAAVPLFIAAVTYFGIGLLNFINSFR